MFSRHITVAAMGLVCAAWVCVFAAILICAKCGYENEAGSRFCSHCGAAFTAGADNGVAPGTNAVTVGGDTTAEGGGAARVSPAVVDGDVRAATENVGKHQGWLALFYGENAMGLNTIAKSSKELTDRVMLVYDKCQAAVRAGVKACRSCAGTGSITRQSTSMSIEGRAIKQEAVKESCMACRGTGIAPGRAGLDALKHGYDSALKLYAVQREGARWIPVGNAWIPLDLDGKLDCRQIAILKRLTSARCTKCAGAGQATCEKCDGTGHLKCPSKKCVGGYYEKTLKDSLTGSPRTIMVRCSECKGAGFISCSECDGSGCIACKKCNGRGKPPICPTCDGDGLAKCTDCKGTGRQKTVACLTCKGCGRILCKACMGSGRVRETN